MKEGGHDRGTPHSPYHFSMWVPPLPLAYSIAISIKSFSAIHFVFPSINFKVYFTKMFGTSLSTWIGKSGQWQCHAFSGCRYKCFPSISKEICEIISALPPKSCDLDPTCIPTWIWKKHLHLLAALITQIVNLRIIRICSFPFCFKSALITQLLKKL